MADGADQDDAVRYILSGAATGRLLLFDSLQPHIAADIEGSELQGDINGVAWSPHDFALIGACSDGMPSPARIGLGAS